MICYTTTIHNFFYTWAFLIILNPFPSFTLSENGGGNRKWVFGLANYNSSYEESFPPRKTWLLYQETAISSRCFQLNASEIKMTLKSLEKDIEFTIDNSDDKNLTDPEKSFCDYRKSVIAVLAANSTLVPFEMPQYEITVTLEFQIVQELEKLVKVVYGMNITIEISNTEENFSETFSNDTFDYQVPLGYSLSCKHFNITGLKNRNSSSEYDSIDISMKDTTLQAFIFTGESQKFSFPIKCPSDANRYWFAMPIIYTILAVFMPFVFIIRAVKSVRRERYERKLELNKDLYALRTGCLNAMRKWLATLRAKVTRRRFNT